MYKHEQYYEHHRVPFDPFGNRHVQVGRLLVMRTTSLIDNSIPYLIDLPVVTPGKHRTEFLVHSLRWAN